MTKPPDETPFNWNDLETPLLMPDRIAYPPVARDVISEVPAAIRMRIEDQLAINVVAIKKAAVSAAKRPRIDYEYRVQRVPDTKVGEEYREYLKLYAKHRPEDGTIPHKHGTSPFGQITIRTGEVRAYRLLSSGIPVACDATEDGAFLGVRYSARPFEERSGARKLPGS